jgi:hypothetical protein
MTKFLNMLASDPDCSRVSTDSGDIFTLHYRASAVTTHSFPGSSYGGFFQLRCH